MGDSSCTGGEGEHVLRKAGRPCDTVGRGRLCGSVCGAAVCSVALCVALAALMNLINVTTFYFACTVCAFVSGPALSLHTLTICFEPWLPGCRVLPGRVAGLPGCCRVSAGLPVSCRVPGAAGCCRVLPGAARL